MAAAGAVAEQQVGGGFATHQEARLPVAHGDDGGARLEVVVAGHDVVVGAGRGHRQQITDGQVVRERDVGYDDVAALAV